MTALTRALLDWYRLYGRRSLPWRLTRDPYRIVVSEYMLQQTQAARVIPLYQAFLALFPDFATLARASTADVLRAWRGLGYNSRAVRLQRLARAVVEEHGGLLPEDAQVLRRLPGMGAYTVAAVRAFAFECDDAATDVNIRRVAHRTAHGLEFPPKVAVRDLDLLAAKSVPPGRGHDWNSAMMDLGATICTARAPKCLVCPLREYCAAAPVDAAELAAAMREHAPKRSPQERIPFEKTTRFLRGRIVDRLRELAPGQAVSFLDLHDEVRRLAQCDEPAFDGIVKGLVRDGIVRYDEHGLGLPT
jgi:A/G-specific adenine glycosylase